MYSDDDYISRVDLSKETDINILTKLEHLSLGQDDKQWVCIQW